MDLTKIAEVLEAAAGYIEAHETKMASAVKAAQKAEVSKLASQLQSATGEVISDSVLDKLADTSPEVRRYLERLSGADRVDSMGGPETSSKTASASELPPGEATLLAFLQS
jgi:hypothetical protein